MVRTMDVRGEAALEKLNISHIVAGTEAEGPGRRFAIWVQGCSIHCPNCCTSELFPFTPNRLVTPEELLSEIKAAEGIEGITLIGGEPFDQAAPAAALARAARKSGLTVVVYTGHLYEELLARSDAGTAALLAATDLLVDGPFIAEKESARRRWIGSDNQRTIFLTDRYRDLENNWPAGRVVEMRFDGKSLTVNGDPLLGSGWR